MLVISKPRSRGTHKSKEQSMHMKEEGGIPIFGTYGRIGGTFTRRSWHIFEYTSNRQQLMRLQDKKRCKIIPNC